MPAPSPSQILAQIRSHYLTRLRQAIADHESDGILQIVPEAALRDKNGTLLRRGNPRAPVRVDLITLVNGDVRDGLTIESETMPGFPPFSLLWKHELPVEIGPFPWNACPVRISNSGIDIDSLLGWFERWFDADESNATDKDGLHGVVHSIGIPSVGSEIVRLVIDFGSAPIECFEEMIDALHSVGAKSLEIGANPGQASQGK